MPITVTVAPAGHAGPGYVVSASSTAPGPLPTGTYWHVQVLDTDNLALMEQALIWIGNIQRFVLGAQTNSSLQQPGHRKPVEDETIHLRIDLINGGTGSIIDTGQLPALKYDSTTQLYQQIAEVASQGGGLTDSEKQQLQRVDQNTQEMDQNWLDYESITLPSLQDVLNLIYAGIQASIGPDNNAVPYTIGQLMSWKPFDVFPDVDLSGGTTCETVVLDLSRNNIQALKVYIDQKPDEFVMTTPGNSWTFRDLAVVSIIRGGTLLERHGIHTLEWTLSPLPQSLSPWPLGIRWGVQPNDYQVTVNWAPGVCGHVIGSTI